MLRIAKAFAAKAKIAYLTAGDHQQSVEYFLALAKGGANILEIGIPFSDPIADGPIIQQAMERALNNATTIAKVLNMVAQIRQASEAALILFTYFNPIQKNLAEFLIKAKQAGADGILVVDLPFEEAEELRFLCNKIGLASIAVAAPSTSLPRIKLLSSHNQGFLYYACRRGTTGMKNELPKDLIGQLKQVQQFSQLPVAVGFGVSNRQMVEEILNVAQGCVIGSYFVNAVSQNILPQKLELMARKVFYAN